MAKIDNIFKDYCDSLSIIQIKDNTHPNSKLVANTNKIKHVFDGAVASSNLDFSYNLDQPGLDTYAYQNNQGMIKILLNSPYQTRHDLHGMRKIQALDYLENLLSNSICTRVLIIHGQGLNSEYNQSILKHLTRNFLSNHARVLCYTKANIEIGGDGATLVQLRKKQ